MLFTPANHKWNDPTPSRDLAKKVAQTRLTGKQRKARIEAAIEMCGFQTKAAFTRHTGITGIEIKSCAGENPQTKAIIRMAVALGVTTDFLLIQGDAGG